MQNEKYNALCVYRGDLIENYFHHFRGGFYSWSCESVHLDIDRENVLGSAMNQIGKILGHALRKRSLSVTFKNEPGMLQL